MWLRILPARIDSRANSVSRLLCDCFAKHVTTLTQKTIAREVWLAGPGLFHGEKATLTFARAEPDSGITFVRQQGERAATIPAIVQNVAPRPRRTCLRNG